jgi:hypothetical protein
MPCRLQPGSTMSGLNHVMYLPQGIEVEIWVEKSDVLSPVMMKMAWQR